MTVSSLINPPQLDVDVRDDIGNVLQEEISPLGEVAELVDSDKSEVDGEVDNDSVVSMPQFGTQICIIDLL